MNSFFRAALALAGIAVTLAACTRINEATELGDELIPAVDNITTFAQTLSTTTDNRLFNDTTKLAYADDVALGNLNDPSFGATTAGFYFNIAPATLGSYPFYNKDSIVGIDSVVLSLAYRGPYGDTLTPQGVKVFEIAQSSRFGDSAFYTFNTPGFATTGAALGAATFQAANLDDTLTLIRKRDTTKVANVLRIRLDNSLGQRFATYDTTTTANGGFRNDSVFYKLFRGLAVLPDGGTGNGLTYFNLADRQKSRLTVYFRVTKNGLRDTVSTDFINVGNNVKSGQANAIKRTPAGGLATYLSNTTASDDQVYIQSLPGSFGAIRIPALDTFQNSIIHRAELIATRVPVAGDVVFGPPPVLFLDRVNAAGDSASTFPNDVSIELPNGPFNFSVFGGILRSDGTYRFNITRYVQSVLSRRVANQSLRLYAPLRTEVFEAAPGYIPSTILNVLPRPAYGRVVLAGGNNADPNLRLQLRIVYSKI
jgi:hypothetical protein